MFPEPDDTEAMLPAAGSMVLSTGDGCEALVPIQRPGRWGQRDLLKNAIVRSITGDFVSLKVTGRRDPVVVRKDAIRRFWRWDGETFIQSNAERTGGTSGPVNGSES